ncbi:MAG TPA: TonB-dependent receptor [Steroidobacteraceae bacterium]
MAISSSNYPGMVCAAIVGMGIAATAMPAMGAAAEDSSPSSDSALSEIIVTATRRAERLQDVPMSITALSGVELTKRGATDVNDIIANSPGLSNPAQGLGTSNNLIIRGVATGAGATLAQATVSFMLDDIDLNPGAVTFGNADPKIVDVQQVEVLRGPQGTLFGAGSLSGVVRFISNKPDLENFSGSVQTTGSSTNHGGTSEDVYGVLNAPLVEGKLGARLVAYYDNDAGWVDDAGRGLSNVNETHTYGARFSLSAKPTEELSVVFTAMDDRTNELGSTSTFYFPQPGLPDYKTEQPYYSVGSAKLDTHIYNLLTTWTPAWGTLTSTTNYFDRFIDGTQDLGAVLPALGLPFTGPNPSAPSVAPNTVHDISQEFRFDSPQMGPVRFTTGAFYQRVASDPNQIVTSNSPVAPLILNGYVNTVQWQAALYGSGTYTLADRIDFTAGVRLSKDVVHFTSTESGALAGANSAGNEVDRPVTPRAAITFRQTNDLTWYVQAAKGYRVGGPNVTAGNQSALSSYHPDNLWNYELGSKARLLDGTLNLNTSLYDIEWSNMQVGLVTPQGFNYIGNGGKARIYGLEEEMVLRATRWLELGGTLSVDHAATTSAAAISRVSFGAFGPAPDLEPNAASTNGVLSGYRLPGSPELQASLYGEAQFPVLGYQAFVRLSGQHVGSAYTDFDSQGLKFGNYTVGNLRAGVRIPHLDVIAFVNNFTNSAGLTSAEDLSLFNVPTGFRVRPRTVGLTLRASF